MTLRHLCYWCFNSWGDTKEGLIKCNACPTEFLNGMELNNIVL